jgi:hypothetical protein
MWSAGILYVSSRYLRFGSLPTVQYICTQARQSSNGDGEKGRPLYLGVVYLCANVLCNLDRGQTDATTCRMDENGLFVQKVTVLVMEQTDKKRPTLTCPL